MTTRINRRFRNRGPVKTQAGKAASQEPESGKTASQAETGKYDVVFVNPPYEFESIDPNILKKVRVILKDRGFPQYQDSK